MFRTLFGDLFEKKIQHYSQQVIKINKLEKSIKTLTDLELQKQTHFFIRRLESGENFEIFLNETFAVAREASYRMLKLRHFDVQVLGGLILHNGKIAEMKTGEGKTLAAILPAYSNALTKKSVHIVTVNDYLSNRDVEHLRQVYGFLGLSVGLVQQNMTSSIRKLNYSKDITYVTSSELGFDYLRDNMAIQLQDIVQRPFYFSILDEADSILIDEARTPLIISSIGDIANEKYAKATLLATSLSQKTHYEIDEKARSITLTEEGVFQCEQKLNILNLYGIQNAWAFYILNAIKAKELFIKNVHYIVKNNTVFIVDEFTGRVMSGRRWGDGLHQAIEAKENVIIQNETQTLASITYQNFFSLYPKLSGMTGTAKIEEEELFKIYGLEVFSIPTHKEMIRYDLSDLIYKNQTIKWKCVAEECLRIHDLGRPILIGTTSVEKSELLAFLLKKKKLVYNVLNAKPENLEREAEIIAQAGKLGSITIATNMAGRGTDIILGGNIKQIAKSKLETILKSLFFQYEKNNLLSLTLKKLRNFLLLKLKAVTFFTVEIENYMTFACEKKFTENPFFISLRATYEILIEIENDHVLEERNTVIHLGGLHVIGTERHEARRIDDQLRGRAGRQGDPGSSQFFLSLDDNLLRIFGGEQIKKMMCSLQTDDKNPIKAILLNKSLTSAQKKIESYYYSIRKQLFDYDEILNHQRHTVYLERRSILETTDLRSTILAYAENFVLEKFNSSMKKNLPLKKQDELLTSIEKLLNLPYAIDRKLFSRHSVFGMRTFLLELVQISYDSKEYQMDSIENGLMREIEKSLLLQVIDSHWKEHLEQINMLKETIQWRSYGQKDPLLEYKNEAYNLFRAMLKNTKKAIINLIFKSQPIIKY